MTSRFFSSNEEFYKAVLSFPFDGSTDLIDTLKPDINQHLQTALKVSDAYKKIFIVSNVKGKQNAVQMDFLPHSEYHISIKKEAWTKKSSENECLFHILKEVNGMSEKKKFKTTVPLPHFLSTPDDVKEEFSKYKVIKPGFNLICPLANDGRNTKEIAEEIKGNNPDMVSVPWTECDVLDTKKHREMIWNVHPSDVNPEKVSFLLSKRDYSSFCSKNNYTVVIVVEKKSSGKLFTQCDYLNGMKFY